MARQKKTNDRYRRNIVQTGDIGVGHVTVLLANLLKANSRSHGNK